MQNEGWDVKDDLQTKITMLVFHTMTDYGIMMKRKQEK